MRITCLLFVLCAVVGISLAWTACTKQSDCEEDECCLDTLFFKRAFCEKRYGADQRCTAAEVYRPETDLYYLACPCVKMYKCLGKETTENGVTYMRDAKCVLPL